MICIQVGTKGWWWWEISRVKLGDIPPLMLEDLPFLTRRKDSQQVASASMRRKWWSSSQEFPLLSQAADRLLSMHATTCATERNWATGGRLYSKSRNRLNLSKAEKLVFIRGDEQGGVGKGVDEEVALPHAGYR